jgi:hypothetical protein
MTPEVPTDFMCAQRVSAIIPSPKNSAAAPDTCGQAIEVPDIEAEHVVQSLAVEPGRLMPADTMFTPGAKISMHLP